MKLENYHTPLSERQKNIEAFTRLIQLSREKRYVGQRIDDQTPEKLAKCVALWLHFEGYKSRVDGCTVRIPFSDGDFIIVCAGTHRSHPNYPGPEYAGDFELIIYNLFSFANWFDNLKTQSNE